MNALLHVIKARAEQTNKSAIETEGDFAEPTNSMHGEQPTPTTIDTDEKCPVIRANQVFLSASNSGRLRVVFF